MIKTNTKKLTISAMMSALAYVFLWIGHLLPTGIVSFVPAANFLKYDPKDIILVIAAFILGPLYALLITIVVSILEMITVSSTGLIGLLMNVIASGCMACTAGVIYKKNKTMKGAIIGLLAGVLCSTAIMTVWNVLITPLYMTTIPSGTSAEEVRAMIAGTRKYVIGILATGIVPFNLIKDTINMAFVLIIYKPVIKALRRAGLVESMSTNTNSVAKKHIASWIIGLFIFATCVLTILAINGQF